MLIAVSTLSLLIFGTRSPVLSLIFMLLLSHHYRVRELQRLLNKTMVTVLAMFVCIALVIVGVRPSSEHAPSVEERISRDVIGRVGTLERKMVVIGHFTLEKIWLGKGYLLVAPIPRNRYPDKPPVDAGVYLKEIAEGGQPKVNVPAWKINATSWPEGNLAGWMNFHLIGYLIFSLVTGMVFGGVYYWVASSERTFSVISLYAGMCYWGAPNLSPLGIVRILVSMGTIALIAAPYRMLSARRTWL
jgi:hypothetical protein